MSLSTILETMDTPMADFNEDSDIPMGMGSSLENWLLPVTHMDEDGQMQQESYSHAESLEVDMAEYEETAEYEMDEAAAIEQNEQPLVDAEVLDVSFSSSPVPPVPQDLAQIQPQDAAPLEVSAEKFSLQPPADEHAQSTPSITLSQPGSGVAGDMVASLQPPSDGVIIGESSIPIHEEQQESGRIDEIALQENSHADATPGAAQERVAAEHNAGLPDESPTHAIEHDQNEQAELAGESDPPPPLNSDDILQVPSIAYDGVTATSDEPPVEHAEEVQTTITSVTVQGPQEVSSIDFDTSNPPPQSEIKQVVQEGEIHEELHATATTEDYHEFTGEEQFDSPPILLKLSVRSSEGDQPDFVLFKLPDSVQNGDQAPSEEPLVLLQHHQELFYESISSIFEAFRHEEYFTHLEELSNAEMLLSAPELQLDVSEDNIYAREISLHDLVAMHQGLGLPGHLKLTLQSVVPRFITRYNQLREQITKLAIGESERLEYEQQELPQQDPLVPNEAVSRQVETGHELSTEDLTEADVSQRPVNESQGQDMSSDVGQEVIEVAAAEQLEDDESNEAADETIEHAGIKDHDDAPYSSEFADGDAEEKEEDFNDELDADRIHDGDDAAHEVDREEERQTEYSEEVVPEDDDDGYEGEGFNEEGSESGGGEFDNEFQEEEDGEDNTSADDEKDNEVQAEHGEPLNAQAQSLSHSTSTTSRSTDNEELEQGGVELTTAVTHQAEEPTDNTPEKETNELTNEGKQNEGQDLEHVEDEFGDEIFEDDEFDEDGATEDTLEESPNSQDGDVEEFDLTSRALLAESEKFVAELGADVGADNVTLEAGEDALDIPSSEDLLRTPVSKATSGKRKADEFSTAHKNSSKRSLDDAGLEETDLVSPPSSPDSKRARKL